MKDVVVRLWPTEPIPNSYFGLVQRLVDAVPCIDAIKRSACIEGARMAFALCQDVLGKNEGRRCCSEEPTRGQGPSHAGAYFGDVLEGARLIEGRCLKDIMFEYVYRNCENNIMIH